MRLNWEKLIFCLIMILVWLMVMFSFIKIATEKIESDKNKKEKKEKYLRENFSRMSEDLEIQKAYKAITNKNK